MVAFMGAAAAVSCLLLGPTPLAASAFLGYSSAGGRPSGLGQQLPTRSMHKARAGSATPRPPLDPHPRAPDPPAGVFYEFAHYLVHCRYVPNSRYWRALRRHHAAHHLRNEAYWLSFSIPQVDALMGTLPGRGQAPPLSDMARANLRASRAAEKPGQGAAAAALVQR